MCGIVGIFRPGGGESEWPVTIRAMAESLRHRGPDDDGEWLDLEAGIALGHCRLSIVELSSLGRQPMRSPSGRYVMVYNGEIYNYLDLRAELEDHSDSPGFRGASDTEVVLAAFDRWGVRGSLVRFVGMFAIAVWDRQEHRLTLARDRLGEKPLYYGWMNGSFLFGSELKALRRHPDWSGDLDRDVLANFLRYGYVPGPASIYRGIHKLPPGTSLRIAAASTPGDLNEPEEYWSLAAVAEAGQFDPFCGSDADAAAQLEDLLRGAVRHQMIADVPLGAFLSGGVDSSTIVALMQSESTSPVRTFSVGFREDDFNEAPHARAVADHLGTDHTELIMTARDALGVIPELPTIWDEPYADSSQIPTLLLSRMTRGHVTVALTGDGGDELFAGYDRYFQMLDAIRKIGRIPRWMQHVLSRSPRALIGVFEGVFNRLGAGRLEALFRAGGFFVDHLPFELTGMYRDGSLSQWQRPGALVPGAEELPTVLTNRSRQAVVSGAVPRMTTIDLVSYLPDDILVKVDRAGMAASLETRMPLLDHRVVEFSQRLPISLKIRGSEGKWILRQVLDKHVPKELVDRPKMGFGVPLADWLRGDLRDWVEALLDETKLRREGILNGEMVQSAWRAHVTGQQNNQSLLWTVLMFQAWQEAVH